VTASSAATWLFVPGDRPDRFDKAVASGADEVILDLEDAVRAESKDHARAAVVAWLDGGGSAWVRVNAQSTPWHDADLAALVATAGLRGLVLPKAEDPAAIAALGLSLGVTHSVIALVESARGVLQAPAIAATAVVSRLAFGSIDFALDIDAEEEDRTSLLAARSALVLASRSADLPPPIDGVTVSIDDADELRNDVRHARSLGFGGKLCIHPRQVPVVGDQLRPTDQQVEWAKAVVAAMEASDGAGAVTGPQGQMLDKPVLEKARRVLDRTGGTDDATA
jgi:citrate lyase subunit beta/citryl-CoA lyase